ncbi:hypothetical protein ID875_21305 [Streptomyces globisporus]|uniref:Uncharacterized protein n=1 Tax=Streptomyces globisporus TaxID=1908 RepID=A0A927BLH7_STRGL|nr:hypothetical protein [Streptomyces globisporus]
MINSADESFYLALTLWGYTDSSAPEAARPADWERARLGLQAGRFLALHTRRPGSSPHRPTELPSGTDPRVQDGWICLKGWRRIVGRTQGPVRLDPDVVAGRMVGRSVSATATGLRQLLDNTARLLRYPEGLPDGVALSIGARHLPTRGGATWAAGGSLVSPGTSS